MWPTDAKTNASTNAANNTSAKFGFPATAAATTVGKNEKTPSIYTSSWYGYGQGQQASGTGQA